MTQRRSLRWPRSPGSRPPEPGPAARHPRRRRSPRGPALVVTAALVAVAGLAAVAFVIVGGDRAARHVVSAPARLRSAARPPGAPTGRPTTRQRRPRSALIAGGRRQPPRIRVPYAAS